MSEHGRRPFKDVEVAELRHLLERVRGAVAQEDYELLTMTVETVIELSRVVRQKGATVARLRRMLGMSSSEKTSRVLPPQRDGKPDEPDRKKDSPGDQREAAKGRDPGKQKPGHGRKPASAYQAEQVAVPHSSLRPGARCPECDRGNLHAMKEPASCLRIFGAPQLRAKRWDAERLRCGCCGRVYTAALPDEARGPKFSESAAAAIAVSHYGMGMPWYRLGIMQGYLQVPVPASTQWEVVLQRVTALLPVYEHLTQLASNGTILHNDDTYMRILELMGERRAKLMARGELADPHRTGLYTTAVVSVTEAGSIALFFTGRQHAGENIAKVLSRRDAEQDPPIQMCDGLDRNYAKEHDVLRANCLSHGRRHIVDEVQSFPEECRHVLEALGQVFHNERTCKKEGLSGQQRLRFHHEHSGPVMAELKQWIQGQLDDKHVEPNSGLGGAFAYLLKRWDKLTLFLHVPDAPLDNNTCERVLKMAIRYRNNSKFYRSVRGARVGDVYMTVIHTTMLHDENPFEYVMALMVHEKLVAQSPADWLPWTFRATLERLQLSPAKAA